MKVLRANKHPIFPQLPNLKVDVVDLNDIELTAEAKWLRKRYQPFEESCNKAGMLFPITYTDYAHYWDPPRETRWPTLWDKYVVHNANKREFYAKKYDYTHIEGYFCDCKDTKDIIVRTTFMGKDYYPK